MQSPKSNKMISHTEENYLKAIFKIAEKQQKAVSTNAISKEIKTSAASVTDMLKRLAEKDLINYAKYKGVSLTNEGEHIATILIRKHRLWEVFLVEKLNFSWDMVHEIAEELEHIKSDELIKRLDAFLGKPRFDPHGDPIPDANGKMHFRLQTPLDEFEINETGVIIGVREHTTKFLQYLDQLNLSLGAEIKVLKKFGYDDSLQILLNKETEILLTKKVSHNLFLEKKNA